MSVRKRQHWYKITMTFSISAPATSKANALHTNVGPLSNLICNTFRVSRRTARRGWLKFKVKRNRKLGDPK